MASIKFTGGCRARVSRGGGGQQSGVLGGTLRGERQRRLPLPPRPRKPGDYRLE
jgi:hypothetical protein